MEEEKDGILRERRALQNKMKREREKGVIRRKEDLWAIV